MELEKILIIHALDDTTKFLSVFKEKFSDDLIIFDAKEESEHLIIKTLNDLLEGITIVFLGHGHSIGLYTPEHKGFYQKKIFIEKETGDNIFNNKNVLLLSCNSNQFISRLTTFKEIIGFGNIISSEEEISIEADSTGEWRDLNEKDIDSFNLIYCNAVIKSLQLFKNKIVMFNKIPLYIEFFINKEINNILKNKQIENRIEIARLLFEFRNEMVYKSNY